MHYDEYEFIPEDMQRVIAFCNYLSDYVASIRGFARDGDTQAIVERYQIMHETFSNLGTYLGLSNDEPATSQGALG